ncbi:MAG TPA: Rieske 2Fe-2S domain-containing protein [Acidimicrobiales bacterium]|nr:Rieske 2Fe-2S domain-containing protein [Acidimicrobiales bacterium]
MAPGLRPVLRSEELVAGTSGSSAMRKVRAGRHEVLVARLSTGQLVAFASRCPHQGTPLEEAKFWDDKVRCARHQYLYDPRTGENVLPAGDAPPESLWKLKPGYLPVHRVEERDGQIWVADEPEPPPPSYDPDRERRASGPLAAADPDPPPAAKVPTGPVEHPVQELHATVGETVELVLPTTPSPGCFWKVELSGPAPPAVAVTGQSVEPGGPPRQKVVLAARSEGEATVRCSYGRPWDSVPREVRAFRFHVEA